MNRNLLIFLLLLTAMRLFVAGHMELSTDESYYYQWSQRLDWAYYSKGPGVAAAIRIGTALFGPNEFGVRFLAPLLSLGTSLVMFQLARRLFANSVAVWTVLMMNVTPIFQAGSVIMTIDALSIFFWAAALWTFWLAIEHSPAGAHWRASQDSKGGFWYWPLTGLLMALGFLSKYTNAMQLLSVVLVLATTARFRSEFRRPGFWALLATFLLGVIPPLLWNAHHDWITVEHLVKRGGLDDAHRFHPLDVFVFFGLHLGVYSPLIFIGMLAALYQGCRDFSTHFKRRFLVLFTLPLLAMYFAISIKKCGEANWTAPAFVSLGILTVAFWHDRLVKDLQFGWVSAARQRLALAGDSASRTLSRVWDRVLAAFDTRRLCTAALVLGLFLSLLLVDSDAIRRLGIPWQYRRDPTGRLHGWQTTAIAIDKIRHDLERTTGKRLFLIANRYQSASAVAFYLPEKRTDGPGHPPVYVPESQAIENQYSFWGRYDELTEIEEVARTLLPTVTDPAKHTALANALTATVDPKRPKTGPDADERRRALIRAMLEADPALPLDEYASQEAAVSLFYGRDALYITDTESGPPRAIVGGFEKVEPVAFWEVTRRGMPLRDVLVFLCHNYHSLPL